MWVGCHRDDVLDQPQRARQSTWTCRTCGDKKPTKSKRFVTKRVGANVNPADLMMKPKIVQLLKWALNSWDNLRSKKNDMA